MSDFSHQTFRQKKNQKAECFCALCRTPRVLRYSRYLKKRHYLQIFIITLGLTAATYPWFSLSGVMSLPLVWALFESIHKSLYRKDLKCPYCGFDPKWYKKDVKLARRKVEEFLKQNPESPLHTKSRSLRENSHQTMQ